MVLMSGSLDLGAPSLLRSKPLAGQDLREPTLANAVDIGNSLHGC